MSMIEVEDLRKDYGSFRALAGIDFRVDRGEILGFLGPNGAGKTTTMKILTGFLHPSGGRAAVAGKDVLEDSIAVRQKIGYLPESTPLYPDMTVREYLRYCGKLRRMGGKRLAERVDAVVGMTTLGPKLRAPIKTLSKGYRQRVGIAQALIHEPEIIILDEPTVGLDPNQVLDARRLISEVGEDRTVILCSHILSEVEAVCGRVVIVNRGRIVADGTPAELAATLGDAHRYEVTVVGTEAALRDALGSADGISDCVGLGSNGPLASAAFTSAADHAGTARVVTAALAGPGLAIARLEPQAASLEEVFRRRTAEEV